MSCVRPCAGCCAAQAHAGLRKCWTVHLRAKRTAPMHFLLQTHAVSRCSTRLWKQSEARLSSHVCITRNRRHAVQLHAQLCRHEAATLWRLASWPKAPPQHDPPSLLCKSGTPWTSRMLCKRMHRVCMCPPVAVRGLAPQAVRKTCERGDTPRPYTRGKELWQLKLISTATARDSALAVMR